MEETKSAKVDDNVHNVYQCKTFVDPNYSYSFGQSSEPLVYKSLGALLDYQCEKIPDNLAVISTHENYQATFAKFKYDVDSLASWMVNSLRIARGDVIVTMTGNTYKSLILQFVAAKIGTILFPINAFYSASEVEYSLNKANPKMFIIPGPESEQEKCINKFHSIVRSLEDKLPKSLEYIVLLDGKQQTDKIGKARVLMYDDLVKSAFNARQINESGEPDINNNPPIPPEFNEPDSPALLISTSGTTGLPKAAILTHFNVVNNAYFCGRRFEMVEGSRICLPLPLFHALGGVVGVLPIATQGCTIVLNSYRYSIEAAANAIINHGCTHLVAVPAMLMDMLDYLDNNKQVSITSLTHIVTGGTLVPYLVVEKMSRMIPSLKTIDIVYGTTETILITVPMSSDSLHDKLDNVGRALDHVEIKIVNQVSGEMVKIGEKGELLTRGHNVFMGYWNDEKQTKASLNEARWYKTGDLATMDSKGYIRIVGRLKDIIIRGGLNIYPGEIEDVLISHPLISFAAVFGLPDERLGEEICAWIKFRDEDKKLTEDQVIKFCKEKMAYFKVPKKLVFVTEFPTTASGKIQKHRMREISMAMSSEVKVINF